MDTSLSLHLLGTSAMILSWKKCLGVSASPAAWAISTQLGQILPYTDCVKQNSSSFIAAAACLAIALTGVAVSWVCQNSAADRTATLVGRLGVGIGLATTFALVLQGTATLLVNACQR